MESFRGGKKASANHPAARGHTHEPCATVGPAAASDSPTSDTSDLTASVRRPFSHRAPCCKAPESEGEEEEDEEQEESAKPPKRGGPCHICWDTGYSQLPIAIIRAKMWGTMHGGSFCCVFQLLLHFFEQCLFSREMHRRM